jgi:hypothetical protein
MSEHLKWGSLRVKQLESFLAIQIVDGENHGEDSVAKFRVLPPTTRTLATTPTRND